MSDRTLQVCDVCGGVDTDPRHFDAGFDATRIPAPTGDVIRRAMDAGATDEHLAALNDTTTSVHHLDCGAGQGCGVCTDLHERAGGKHGKALDKALTDLNKES